MPTAKNGLWILNLHPKNNRKQKKDIVLIKFNVVLLKYYRKVLQMDQIHTNSLIFLLFNTEGTAGKFARQAINNEEI